ncbi:unnamed protein product [Ceratitis capitata]|uniref:(Mediterranean fruit fly) hypothetical protein n=1 Tax=Ceratitis capitata TaxID=7213 RepID=A0A811VFG8_CERCA|nr:unnamed protein product [Ceratitis capitata]
MPSKFSAFCPIWVERCKQRIAAHSRQTLALLCVGEGINFAPSASPTLGWDVQQSTCRMKLQKGQKAGTKHKTNILFVCKYKVRRPGGGVYYDLHSSFYN